MENNWTHEEEMQIVEMRKAGMSYTDIASKVGRSPNSIKHKARRIGQAKNEDRYKHTDEKISQISKFISGINNSILETHCGHGSLSEFYNLFGTVDAYDISKEKVDFVNSLYLEGVTAVKCDSEKIIIRLLSFGSIYDIIDIDPYGFPSRYFPYVFGLIDDGILFLTFPVMGVAQINKITIRHYQAFWGIELSDKDCYVDKIVKKLHDYSFMFKREIEVLDIAKIDRIYRFAIRVKKESLLKIVGLEVQR